MYELLLSRYHNISEFNEFDFEVAILFINETIKKRNEELIYQRWLAELPARMMTGNQISFLEFKDKIKPIRKANDNEVKNALEQAQKIKLKLERNKDGNI